MSGAGHESCGKHQVERVFGFEVERQVNVIIGLGCIAFRIPIDGQIAIGESDREGADGIFHQRQSLFEFAFVDRNLTQTVQGDSARKRIGLHGQDLVKHLPGLVPIARLVTVKLAQITERNGIGGIHAMRFGIQLFGLRIFACVLGLQSTEHHGFDAGALGAIKNRRIGNLSNIVDAQLLQFFLSIFGALGEEAFFFDYRLIQGNGAGVVAAFGFFLGCFEFLLQSFVALFDFAVENLLDLLNFQEAFIALGLGKSSPIRRSQNGDRQLGIGSEFLAGCRTDFSNLHRHALSGIHRERARVAQAGIVDLFL